MVVEEGYPVTGPVARPSPEGVVGALAEPTRLRVVAALVLGASTLPDVAERAGVTMPAAQRALDRLTKIGLVEPAEAGGSWRLRAEVLEEMARARTRPDPVPPDATAEQAEVLRHFVKDGRLTSLPAARSKRLAVLDWLAGRFEPGRVYPERDVNFRLGQVYPDYAALRRYLVDEGLMERREGFYWRSGGTFETE